MSSQRILVVDDDPLIVRLVRMHLDRAGYNVLVATDGEEALDVCAVELPHLVNHHLMQPKRDGYHGCSSIREL